MPSSVITPKCLGLAARGRHFGVMTALPVVWYALANCGKTQVLYQGVWFSDAELGHNAKVPRPCCSGQALWRYDRASSRVVRFSKLRKNSGFVSGCLV